MWDFLRQRTSCVSVTGPVAAGNKLLLNSIEHPTNRLIECVNIFSQNIP